MKKNISSISIRHSRYHVLLYADDLITRNANHTLLCSLQVEVALAHEQAKLLDYLAGSGQSLPPNHDFIVLRELLK
jgi:hypothetical protein